MFKNTKDPFKKAEALGDLTTMPVMETMNQAQEPQKKAVVSNPEEFRTAQWEAQHDGTGYIEVTEELYKFIIKITRLRALPTETLESEFLKKVLVRRS
jgi:hypothetical protein